MSDELKAWAVFGPDGTWSSVQLNCPNANTAMLREFGGSWRMRELDGYTCEPVTIRRAALPAPVAAQDAVMVPKGCRDGYRIGHCSVQLVFNNYKYADEYRNRLAAALSGRQGVKK